MRYKAPSICNSRYLVSADCRKVTAVAIMVMSLIAAVVLLPHRGYAAAAGSMAIVGLILLVCNHRSSAPRQPQPQEAAPEQRPQVPESESLIEFETPFPPKTNEDQTQNFAPTYPLLAKVGTKADAARPLSSFENLSEPFNCLADYLTLSDFNALVQCSSSMNVNGREYRDSFAQNITNRELCYRTQRLSTPYTPDSTNRLFFNARLVMQSVMPILEILQTKRNDLLARQFLTDINALSGSSVNQFFEVFYSLLEALRGPLKDFVFAVLSNGIYGGNRFQLSETEKDAVKTVRVAMFSIMHGLVGRPSGDADMAMRCTIRLEEDHFADRYGPNWNAVCDYYKMKANLGLFFHTLSDEEWEWTVQMAARSDFNENKLREALITRPISEKVRIAAIKIALEFDNKEMFKLLCTEAVYATSANRNSVMHSIIEFAREDQLKFLLEKKLSSDVEIISYITTASGFGRLEMMQALKERLGRELTIPESRVCLRLALDGPNHSSDRPEETRLAIQEKRKEVIAYLIGNTPSLRKWTIDYAVKHGDAGQNLDRVDVLIDALKIDNVESAAIIALANTAPSLRVGYAALQAWINETLQQE